MSVGASRLATLVALGVAFALASAPWSLAQQDASAEELQAIEARARIVPRTALFGDTVSAIVDVTLDRQRVDPDSVRVAAEFAPWELAGAPERVRRDAGPATYLRTTYRIRCLTGACIPNNQSMATAFGPARVSYAPTGESAARETVDVAWPLALVYSRFAVSIQEGSRGPASPWRADLVSMPAVSYRVAPGLLVGGLLAVAGLLAAAGLVLAYAARPRRAPVVEREPEPEPEPALSPLEQALVLLEDPARANGAADQRRALELVAEELEERGEREIARTARTLAWSEDVPPVAETTVLATRVRDAIVDIGDEDGVEGSGDAPLD